MRILPDESSPLRLLPLLIAHGLLLLATITAARALSRTPTPPCDIPQPLKRQIPHPPPYSPRQTQCDSRTLARRARRLRATCELEVLPDSIEERIECDLAEETEVSPPYDTRSWRRSRVTCITTPRARPPRKSTHLLDARHTVVHSSWRHPETAGARTQAQRRHAARARHPTVE